MPVARPLSGWTSNAGGPPVLVGYSRRDMEDWRPPIPAAIFLDTSIVLDLDRFGEHIFDGVPLGPTLPDQQRRQIEALRVLMALVDRAGLAVAVSPEVIREARGRPYVRELSAYWDEMRRACGIEERGLAPMTVVAELPPKDQLVLAQAFRSGCEAILTSDLQWTRRTHRRTIAALGMSVYTPEELLGEVRPWLALWL